MPEQRKSPIDQALDLFVYAPLGLALTAREHLPELVEKGRQRMDAQLAMARVMGQYAVAEAQKQAKQRVDDLTETFAGRAETAAAPAPESSSPAPAAAPAADEQPAPAASPAAGPAASNGRSGAPSSDHLAIPGYDTLSASQVVQRLAGLSGDELDAVRAYEEATRGRRTILTKIAQLQSA